MILELQQYTENVEIGPLGFQESVDLLGGAEVFFSFL